MPVLLLTTTGRRTGQPRRVGLTYLPYASGYAVIGSNGGAVTHPDWVLNLRANPRATIQVGNQSAAMRAREAGGDERRRLWDRAAAAYAGYEAYRQRTGRKIPVVVFEPSSDLHDGD